MSLSGNWKVTVTAAKGIKSSPDTLEFEIDGKSSSFPITATFGATETVRKLLRFIVHMIDTRHRPICLHDDGIDDYVDDE